MKHKYNVAVFPCGTEIGLEIASALRGNKHINLVGFNSRADHSQFVYDSVDIIPEINDPDFAFILNSSISRHAIHLLIPAHDLFLDYIVDNRNKINCRIATHPLDTIKACRSKRNTYRLFPNFSPILITKEIAKNDWVTNKIDNTYFEKPDMGFGSIGARKIIGIAQTFSSLDNSSVVLTEYLPGDEYTVDCFTDKFGVLKVVSPRQRTRLKSGIAIGCESVSKPIAESIKTMADEINLKLQFDGAWFFQLKTSSNHELKLLEIAPRIAGSSGFTRMNGNNLPLMSIYNAMYIPVDAITSNENHIKASDRALSSKFSLPSYHNLFIDFDDTLIIDSKVNSELIALIYQCKNENKDIYIISRNNLIEIDRQLSFHKIDRSLFKHIITVEEWEYKSQFILEDSIFIDDSFSERKDVNNVLNIPVFDVSEVSGLLK